MIDLNLLAHLADELDAARSQIEALGVALCDKPELASQVITQMQGLDHVAQRCDNIARILRAPDMLEEGSGSGLETIRLGFRPFVPAHGQPPSPPARGGDEFFWDDAGDDGASGKGLVPIHR